MENRKRCSSGQVPPRQGLVLDGPGQIALLMKGRTVCNESRQFDKLSDGERRRLEPIPLSALNSSGPTRTRSSLWLDQGFPWLPNDELNARRLGRLLPRIDIYNSSKR